MIGFNPDLSIMNRFTRVLTGIGASLFIWGACLVPAYAQGLDANKTGLSEAAQKAGYNSSLTCLGKPGGCIATFAGAAINALAGLFGAVFLGLILYGGFQYLFSQGDKNAVAKARGTIVNAIIGLLIVVLSYSVVNFVFNALTTVTQTTTTEQASSSQTTTQTQ
jgi:hypothetical protein